MSTRCPKPRGVDNNNPYLKGEHDSGEDYREAVLAALTDKVDADEDDFRLLIAIRILDVGHGQGRNACQEDGASTTAR
eukprot:scaffold1026_cov272-Pinguiococcus_pyrenoidosus.AAC.5